MTRGGIAKILAVFSAPLILSGLLQQLYSWADALIVGNFAGEAQLSAIGAATPPSMLFIAVLLGFSTGVSIQVSTAFGKKDFEQIKQANTIFLAISLVGSVIFAALGIAFGGAILRLLDTPKDIMGHSLEYLSVILLGVPCMAVYNHYAATLRGIGDSRTPLVAIVISSVLNVSLDLLFVARWGMGVYGAALSTVIAQAALAVFIVGFAWVRYPMLRCTRVSMRGGAALSAGLKLSVPSAAQSAIRSVGALLLQAIMNGFGSQVVAGVTSAYRVDSIALLPVINLSSGISTFTAQNAGAGDGKRVREGLRMGWRLSVGISLAICAFIVPLCGWLIALFGVSAAAVGIGRELILTLVIGYPVFGLLNALNGYLQGLGDMMFTSAIGIGALALRIALSYALRPVLGRQVIAVAELIAWIVQAAVCMARVRRLRGALPGATGIE